MLIVACLLLHKTVHTTHTNTSSLNPYLLNFSVGLVCQFGRLWVPHLFYSKLGMRLFLSVAMCGPEESEGGCVDVVWRYVMLGGGRSNVMSYLSMYSVSSTSLTLCLTPNVHYTTQTFSTTQPVWQKYSDCRLWLQLTLREMGLQCCPCTSLDCDGRRWRHSSTGLGKDPWEATRNQLHLWSTQACYSSGRQPSICKKQDKCGGNVNGLLLNKRRVGTKGRVVLFRF